MNEIPPLPTTWVQLIAYLGLLAFLAFNTWQNRQLKQQNVGTAKKVDTTIAKVDASLKNQGEMKEQLDGATSAAIATASALGVAQGNLAGAASEQAREATRVGLASDVAQRLAETEGKS